MSTAAPLTFHLVSLLLVSTIWSFFLALTSDNNAKILGQLFKSSYQLIPALSFSLAVLFLCDLFPVIFLSSLTKIGSTTTTSSSSSSSRFLSKLKFFEAVSSTTEYEGENDGNAEKDQGDSFWIIARLCFGVLRMIPIIFCCIIFWQDVYIPFRFRIVPAASFEIEYMRSIKTLQKITGDMESIAYLFLLWIFWCIIDFCISSFFLGTTTNQKINKK